MKSTCGYATKGATGTIKEIAKSYLGVEPYLWITLDEPVTLSSGRVKEIGRSTKEVELL